MKGIFDVTISPDNDNNKFLEACKKLETAYPDANKWDIVMDVDGTLLQIYIHDKAGNRTIIYNDYEVGAVYVKSDIDLSGIFTDWKNL